MGRTKIPAQQLNNPLTSKLIISTRVMTAASGDVAYTGVGFQPTAIIALQGIVNTVAMGMGVADSTKTAANVAQATAGNEYDETSQLITCGNTSGNEQTAIVKSYDSDGFTLTWTKTGSPTGTANLYFLCFK